MALWKAKVPAAAPTAASKALQVPAAAERLNSMVLAVQ
jgi:hypothetical protein